MRKFAILAAMLAMVAILSGCVQIARGRSEIDKLFIARIISIDETAEGKVRITLTTKSLSTGGGGGQQETQKGESIVAEGDTVLHALTNMSIYSDRKPSFGHAEYILFGESLARKGIIPYLDFVSRQNQFRYNAKVYIVKDGTANSLVEKSNTSKMFVGDRISNIEQNSYTTSLTSVVTLNEAILIFDNKNLDTFIPFAELINAMTTSGKQEACEILLRGYAVFKKDKLSYFTPIDEARGLSWIMNRQGTGVVIVKSRSGEEISMDVIDRKVKLIPRIEGNELHCTLKASFTTNIGEIMGNTNVTDIENLQYLKKQQNDEIRKILEKAVKSAQEKNSDHFSTITKFIIKYPGMRDYFETNWKELFPEVKFEYQVESNIKGTYLLNEPSGMGSGAEEE